MSFDDQGERELGRDVDYDDDPADRHEGRRNALMAGGVAAVALVLVGAMFWLMSSLNGPKLALDAAPKPTTSTTDAAAAPAAPETSSVAPPTIATYTPSTTFSLPPPEQPTMTAPPAASTTAAPAPAPATTTQAPAPPPAPTTPPAPAAPPAPSVTNVNLTCSKGDGKKVTGTLSFTTNTKVSAAISAGGAVQSKPVGPGDVSLTASGRGPGVCVGKINDQVVGPIPAT